MLTPSGSVFIIIQYIQLSYKHCVTILFWNCIQLKDRVHESNNKLNANFWGEMQREERSTLEEKRTLFYSISFVAVSKSIKPPSRHNKAFLLLQFTLLVTADVKVEVWDNLQWAVQLFFDKPSQTLSCLYHGLFCYPQFKFIFQGNALK